MGQEYPAPGDHLEIEKICAPFNRAKPVNLGINKPPANLVLPGEDNRRLEFPVLRAKMLRPIFRAFGKNAGTLDARVGKFRSDGLEPVDAIYLAVMTLVRESMNQASETDREFSEAKVQYDLLHFPHSRFSLGTRNSMSEMRMFIGHGTSVLVATQEGAVQTYREQVDPGASADDLESLLPSSTQRMFSSLTRVPGDFAVKVETALSRKLRVLGIGTQQYQRLQFNPDKLILRDGNEGLELDCRKSIRKVIEAMQHDTTAEYHGCLAGLVRMGKGPDAAKTPTVFDYVDELTADLLKRHWLPTIAGK